MNIDNNLDRSANEELQANDYEGRKADDNIGSITAEIKSALPRNDIEPNKKIIYHIEARGSLSYIVNAYGKVVSEGYHSFKPFQSEGNDLGITALVAVRGSLAVLLSIPSNENVFFKPSSGAHSFNYREDLGGIFTLKIGALEYILNTTTGKPASEGYHEIFLKDGQLYGRRGTTIKIINNRCLPVLPRKVELIF